MNHLLESCGTGDEYDANLWRHVGSLVWPYAELVLHVLDRHTEEAAVVA